MSGQPGSPKKRGGRSNVEPRTGGDDCDLSFQLDLSSLRPAVLQVVHGELLDVDLVTDGRLDALICRKRVGNAVVGSLAAFQGLAALIDCIRRGNRYVAKVIGLSQTTCRVHVTRASA